MANIIKVYEYPTFKEAVLAMVGFIKQGLKCKGVGLTTIEVYIEED